MMEKWDDKRKLPRPSNFNFNIKSRCSYFSNHKYYLSTAQISSSPHSIFLPLKFFLHLHDCENHFWHVHPICIEYDSQSVRSVHTTTCALSLNLQRSFILWKSQIIFMPSKWENVPDARWWRSPWETIMEMCWWALQNWDEKAPLGLAELPHPWVNSVDVATKHGGLGKG